MARKGTIISWTIVVIFIFTTLFPIYWFFTMSIKPRESYVEYAQEIVWFPSKPTLEHLTRILRFGQEGQLDYLVNSTIIAIGTTALVLLLASPAAYAFARLKFKGSQGMSMWILSLRLIPPICAVIPIYLLINFFHLIDTYIAVIIAHTLFVLPFAIWVLRSFFIEVPPEIEESAMVDGCSRWGALIRIIIPVSSAAIVTVAIFSMIFSWSEFLFALVLTRSSAATLPVSISLFKGHMEIMWGEISSASLMATLPIVIFYFMVYRHLIRGLTLGAVKG